MKALRVLTITDNRDSQERITVKLYKEGELFVWRLGGELGDPVELFEPSSTLRAAVNNAIAVWDYTGSPWRPEASWLI